MAKERVYAKYTAEALNLLAKQIKLGRKKNKWTEADLAERAGIARVTLQKIEKGYAGCAIGLYFEVAVLVGVKLFDSELMPLSRQLAQTDTQLAVLPQKVRKQSIMVDDEF